jgi:predicted nucleic acid-binding protein
MNGPDFVDTNVLVYAYDASHPHKRKAAQELVRRAVAGEILASVQVLAEFAATLLHKVSASPQQLKGILDSLAPIRIIVPDREIIWRAVEARARYGIHFYDGMIVAAAERGGSARIWSEDLNPGQAYFGIRVQNPFA